MTSPTPSVSPASGTYRILGSVDICVSGFDPSAEVVTEVSVPGVENRRRALRNVAQGNVWVFELGIQDPTGPYAITATQGQRRATGGFTAVLPDRPIIETVGGYAGAPGTTFRFGVVTPAPNQPVSIDLYRQEGYTFVTTLGTVTTDGRGRTVYELPTRSDSPAGGYCLLIRPFDRLQQCAGFSVR